MPRKYRHIKGYEKKLIVKQGTVPCFIILLPSRLFLTVCTILGSSPITAWFFTIMLW